jgi:hypothetical protein
MLEMGLSFSGWHLSVSFHASGSVEVGFDFELMRVVWASTTSTNFRRFYYMFRLACCLFLMVFARALLSYFQNNKA